MCTWLSGPTQRAYFPGRAVRLLGRGRGGSFFKVFRLGKRSVNPSFFFVEVSLLDFTFGRLEDEHFGRLEDD